MAGPTPASHPATPEGDMHLYTPRLRRLIVNLVNGHTQATEDEIAEQHEDPFEFLKGRATTDDSGEHIFVDGVPITDDEARKLELRAIAALAFRLAGKSHND